MKIEDNFCVFLFFCFIAFSQSFLIRPNKNLPGNFLTLRSVNNDGFRTITSKQSSTIDEENNVSTSTQSTTTSSSSKFAILEQFEDYSNLQELKKRILHLSALTNRGDLHSESVGRGGIYKERKAVMLNYVDELVRMNKEKVVISDEKLLEGEWELVYANAQLFRSSPFFLAIQTAFDSKEKSELFFRLHELQVMSFGLSSIGRITQEITLPVSLSTSSTPISNSASESVEDVIVESTEEKANEDKTMGAVQEGNTETKTTSSTHKDGQFVSSFDTTIFPLTAIPVVGFWKLLPTFGGKVITTSVLQNIDRESGILDLEVETTSFRKIEGVDYMPLVGKSLENKEVPVGKIWPRLPWNKGAKAKTTITIKYLDEDMRISQDASGAIYIYTRPL